MHYNVMSGREERLRNWISIRRDEDAQYLVVVPHAGVHVPRICYEHLNYTSLDFQLGVDQCADDIYQLPGATTVLGRLHRFVIDHNRDRDDHGVIRKLSFRNNPLGCESYSPEMREHLLSYFHDPFSCVVENEMIELRQRHGIAFLLNGHSMEEMTPPCRQLVESQPRPAFGLMTNHFRYVDKHIAETLANALELYARRLDGFPSGFKGNVVKLDYPYERFDGCLTDRFGRPGDGFQSLLLEVNQGLYWNDEARFVNTEALRMVQRVVTLAMGLVARELRA